MKIEINSKNEIRIWDLDNPNELNAPFFLQPDWPNGTPWLTKAEAQAWADLFVLSLTDETSDLPGDGPDQPTKPRPVIVEDVAE